jgi:spore coat protein CotH
MFNNLLRRDPVTIVQCALLGLGFALMTPFVLGFVAPRPAQAQGPGGFPGGPGGRGFGPPQELQIVAQFDKNKDKRLEADERKAAREWLATNGSMGRRGFGGRGGRGIEPGTPGRALSPADVRKYGSEPLYDPKTVRTIFLQFENADWEQELAAFNNTDVEVPATAIVDGRTYKDVGVHFRGMSSFMMVPEGSKRSLNLTFDFVDEKQALGGYRTLNLLNANGDPTLLRTVLYSEVARKYLPAPKANFMRVVINGESWGVYVNAQQYNKDFVRDYFKTVKGARWKVPGSPGGRGGMEYLGEDVAVYKRIYQIKSKDDPKVWADLIKMFRVLNQTPPEKLESALSPLLDIDGALKFLAVEMALVNTDGYWARASDYSIYQDERGRFHVIPHDMNEALLNEGGPGGPGGPRGFGPGGPPPDSGRGFPPDGGPGRPPDGFPPPAEMGRRGGRGFGPGGGPDLDPLVGMDDPGKPLRSKLLAVPPLRARYMRYIREIAELSLDWKTLGPTLKDYQTLIADDVRADTRKLYSWDAFQVGLSGSPNSLQGFTQRRREFLLNVTGPGAQIK